jgi:hypothetical protein
MIREDCVTWFEERWRVRVTTESEMMDLSSACMEVARRHLTAEDLAEEEAA